MLFRSGTQLNNDTHTDLSNSAYEVSGENNNFFTQFGGTWQQTTGGIWAGLNNWHTSDIKKINEREYYLFNAKVKQLGYDKTRAESMYLAWALLADSAGFLNSAGNGSYTREDLSKILSSGKWNYSKDLIDYYANFIVNDWKKGPYKSKNQRQPSINWDLYEITEPNPSQNAEDGYHKAGLNRVPKDNYRALLHKNEMVLNQEEAESYRLQKEYERNNFAGKSEMKGFGIGGSVGNYSYGNYPSYAGHTGIDFNTPIGTPIGSATAGTVVESLDKRGNQANGYASFGRWVVVKSDDNGLYYLYAHLKERLANKGQHVSAGELIGYSGNNGNVRPLPTASNPSAGQHLHFQVGTSPRGGHVNPERYATEAIFSVNGSSSSSNNSGESTDNSNSSGQKVSALAKSIHSERRLLPGIGGDGDIPDGVNPVDRIVTSVDGVSTKIIKYLDEIRDRKSVV